MSVVLQESEDKVTTSSEVPATIYNCSHHHTVHYAGTQINSFSTVRTSWTVTICSACRNIPFVYGVFSPMSQKCSRSILKKHREKLFLNTDWSWVFKSEMVAPGPLLAGADCQDYLWLLANVLEKSVNPRFLAPPASFMQLFPLVVFLTTIKVKGLVLCGMVSLDMNLNIYFLNGQLTDDTPESQQYFSANSGCTGNPHPSHKTF